MQRCLLDLATREEVTFSHGPQNTITTRVAVTVAVAAAITAMMIRVAAQQERIRSGLSRRVREGKRGQELCRLTGIRASSRNRRPAAVSVVPPQLVVHRRKECGQQRRLLRASASACEFVLRVLRFDLLLQLSEQHLLLAVRRHGSNELDEKHACHIRLEEFATAQVHILPNHLANRNPNLFHALLPLLALSLAHSDWHRSVILRKYHTITEQ